MWPAANTSIEEFGANYKIQVAYDLSYNLRQIHYIFETSKTVSKLKEDLGNMVFGAPMTEKNQVGDFVGETNDQDDPLQVMLFIEETSSTNYISLYFRYNFRPDSFNVLSELVDMYLSGNSIIKNNLNEGNFAGEGFEYDSSTGKSAVYRYWQLGNSAALDLLDDYEDIYEDYPGFIDEISNPGSNPNFTPTISFTYDIYGDGEIKCVAFVQAYSDGNFRIMFGTR